MSIRRYKKNPIHKTRLKGVLSHAINNEDEHEAESAKQTALKFLLRITDDDLDILTGVISSIPRGSDPEEANEKLKAIMMEAAQSNSILKGISTQPAEDLYGSSLYSEEEEEPSEVEMHWEEHFSDEPDSYCEIAEDLLDSTELPEEIEADWEFLHNKRIIDLVTPPPVNSKKMKRLIREWLAKYFPKETDWSVRDDDFARDKGAAKNPRFFHLTYENEVFSPDSEFYWPVENYFREFLRRHGYDFEHYNHYQIDIFPYHNAYSERRGHRIPTGTTKRKIAKRLIKYSDLTIEDVYLTVEEFVARHLGETDLLSGPSRSMRRLRRYRRNADEEPNEYLKAIRPQKAKGVSSHRYFSKYQAKTVCTSAVLAAFGIDACSYNYSGYLDQRNAILRRNGWAARSRNSHLNRGYRNLKLPKGPKSVGGARKIIAWMNKETPEKNKWGDPPGTRYMLRVAGHALLLDYNGETIVDTDPRKRDRRKITDIRAVFPNSQRTNPWYRGYKRNPAKCPECGGIKPDSEIGEECFSCNYRKAHLQLPAPILYEQYDFTPLPMYEAPEACDCEVCRSMCKRPCWPTPQDAKKLMDLGYGDRLMIDYWAPDDFLDHTEILVPAFHGLEKSYAPSSMSELFRYEKEVGCNFLTAGGHCEIHSICKPTEGYLASCKGTPRELHLQVAQTWDTPEAKALVEQWKKEYWKKEYRRNANGLNSVTFSDLRKSSGIPVDEVIMFNNGKRVGKLLVRPDTPLPEFLDITNCPRDMRELHEKFGPGPVYKGWTSEINDPSLRRKGFGLKLYERAIAGLKKRHPEGFYFIPAMCGRDSPHAKTSQDAKRVWSSLGKRYPSSGLCLYIG